MSDTMTIAIKSRAYSLVEALGKKTLTTVHQLDGFIDYLREVMHWMFKGKFRQQLVFFQMEFIGNQSLNIIIASGLAVGAVFGLQIGAVFQVFRAENLMGGATAKALTQELAPLMTSVLIAGRAGSAMTAEIATMKVNEQIDAMEAMAVDPVSYLVVPRVIASIVIVPLLCILFIFMGILGSYLIGSALFDIDQGLYVEKIRVLVQSRDIWRGLTKAFAFSGVMALICCRYGLNASGGAKGVGLATTNAVVVTLLSILGIDVIMTYFQIMW